MNNDTSSTLPATAHTTFSTQANMSPSTEVILSTTTMIHLSATSSTQYERDVMPSSTTMAHISATPNTPNMTVTPTNSRVAARKIVSQQALHKVKGMQNFLTLLYTLRKLSEIFCNVIF